MTLNLNNHLLQPINGLLTTFLRQLLIEKLPGMTYGVLGAILGLIRNVGRSAISKRVDSGGSSSLGIHAGRSSLLGIVRSKVGSIPRIARPSRVARLSGIASRIAHVLRAERLLLIILVSSPSLHVRHGRNVMPGVGVGRTVNLTELVLRGLNTTRRLGRSVTGNVTEKEGSVVH